jgi:hypothetical protein
MGSVTDVSHCTICSMSSDHEDMDLDLDWDLRVGDLYLDLDLKANDLDLDSDLRSEDLTTTLGATIQVLRSWYSREHEKLLLKLLVNYIYYGRMLRSSAERYGSTRSNSYIGSERLKFS